MLQYQLGNLSSPEEWPSVLLLFFYVDQAHESCLPTYFSESKYTLSTVASASKLDCTLDL